MFLCIIEAFLEVLRGVKKKYLTPLFQYSRMHKSGVVQETPAAKRIYVEAHTAFPKKVCDMEKIVEQGILYDFYGELLTRRQRQIYENIVYDNLSLGEIAQEEGISRQAVHDIVRRCDRALQEYEDKLQLIARFEKIKAKISAIDRLSEQFAEGDKIDRDTYRTYSAQVRKLSEEILQQL